MKKETGDTGKGLFKGKAKSIIKIFKETEMYFLLTVRVFQINKVKI
tara:strand:- start:202 stop:339 length:138 start_codon:yes stop_codon:yes gene_type:complete